MTGPNGHSARRPQRLAATLVALATCAGPAAGAALAQTSVGGRDRVVTPDIARDRSSPRPMTQLASLTAGTERPVRTALHGLTIPDRMRSSDLTQSPDVMELSHLAERREERAPASAAKPAERRANRSERGRLRLSDLWPPPPAWDVSAFLAWRGVRYHPTGYTRFSSRSHGGAAAGYYWTPHVKTEVEVGTSSSDALDLGHPAGVDVPGLPYRPLIWSSHAVQDKAVVALIGLYQFGNDAFFHPNIGVGIEWTRSRDVATTRAQTISIGPDRPPVVLVPQTTTTVDTDVTARPLITTGFKLYANSRFFVRSDLLITIGRSPTNVSARVGAGVDF